MDSTTFKTLNRLTRSDLTEANMKQRVNLEDLRSTLFYDPNDHEFFKPPGREHYLLLAYLSTFVNNRTIVDLGTHRGNSALALSYNQTNTVHTFDIEDRIPNMDKKNARANIRFRLENIFLDLEKYRDLLLQSPILFLDIDPHDGPMELQLYQFLRDNHYTGILVCDDVWHFQGMRNKFWYTIPAEYKYDLTDVGHWSGTGIISFMPLALPPMTFTSEYTLVTAYFDLTKCPDASPQIKARDQAHYIGTANSTMSLPCALVVYCDQASYPSLFNLRPSHLAHITKYVVMEFDEFSIQEKTFPEWRTIIQTNRKEVYQYREDPRNTASYYLFCMSRYIMLQQTIKENPFHTSHFAWINVCMERMGIQNIRRLQQALSIKRDKFSTCYIDYIPQSLIENPVEYFQYGRCSMCSGFFTGNAFYMSTTCGLILDQFVEYANEGFGHADEQLFSPVYFKNPDLFEHYYGDYQQMITNYVQVHDNPEAIIHHFMRNSFAHGNYEKCVESCEYLYKSLRAKTCQLNNDYLVKLGQTYGMALSKI